MITFKVEDFLSPNVIYISPESTLQEALLKMKKHDCGFLPIGDQKNVEGVITDRDVIVRAVCDGKDLAREKVKDYMTSPAISCNVLDGVEDAIDKMHAHKISRLVVKNSFGTIMGILSFGNLLNKEASAHEVTNIVIHSLRRIVA